ALRQEHGAHADKRAAANADAVQDGPMSDDDVLLDGHRESLVGVDNAEILDVDPRPERDTRQVAPQDGPVPEVHSRGADDVPGDYHARRYIIAIEQSHRRFPPRAILLGETPVLRRDPLAGSLSCGLALSSSRSTCSAPAAARRGRSSWPTSCARCWPTTA